MCFFSYFQYAVKTGKLLSLSEQQLVDCAWTPWNDPDTANLGCDGGYAAGAMQVHNYAFCEGSESVCMYDYHIAVSVGSESVCTYVMLLVNNPYTANLSGNAAGAVL